MFADLHDIIVTIIAGVLNYGLIRWLDRAMDYTHVFGFVRYSLFALNANISEKREIIKAKNCDDPLVAMDDTYWRIARRKWWTKVLICVNCQLFWISLLVGFVFDLNVFILLSSATLVSLWK